MSDALARLDRLRSLRAHLTAGSKGPLADASARRAALIIDRPAVNEVKLEQDRGRQSKLSLSRDVALKHDRVLSDRKRDGATCKERPKPQHKRTAGGGASRPFIPWCDRRRS